MFGERYEVIGPVGQGGMGVVYKAKDRETNEFVALKTLRPEIASDQASVERFKNEVRIARKVAHRNVCRIYDFNRVGDTAFISMEFVEGETLRSLLKRLGRLSEDQAINIASQVCLQGRTVDHRCDIYAFGLILFEMITGSLPASGNKDRSLPIAVEHIVEKCLKKEVLDRYQSASEIESQLHSKIPATTSIFTETHLVMRPRPARLLHLLIQLGYLALYCAILYYFEGVQRLVDWAAQVIGVLAMCGIAIRLYLISSVVLDHPEAGKKFQTLFPLLLIFDSLAAASPLLLVGKIRIGLALIFCAGMAYLPFSQKTLMQNAYRK